MDRRGESNYDVLEDTSRGTGSKFLFGTDVPNRWPKLKDQSAVQPVHPIGADRVADAYVWDRRAQRATDGYAEDEVADWIGTALGLDEANRHARREELVQAFYRALERAGLTIRDICSPDMSHYRSVAECERQIRVRRRFLEFHISSTIEKEVIMLQKRLAILKAAKR